MDVYFFRQEHTPEELRRLARQETGRVCQRLLLIANLRDGMERTEAARLAGLGRSASYDWQNRYEEYGIEGLRDRPRAVGSRLIPKAVGQALKADLMAGADLERDGVVAFRGVDAQRLLAERHGIKASLSAVYRLLHRENLSWLMPRPRHPKGDAQAQAEFSQLSNCNLNESRRRGHREDESASGLPTKPELVKRT